MSDPLNLFAEPIVIPRNDEATNRIKPPTNFKKASWFINWNSTSDICVLLVRSNRASNEPHISGSENSQFHSNPRWRDLTPSKPYCVWAPLLMDRKGKTNKYQPLSIVKYSPDKKTDLRRIKRDLFSWCFVRRSFVNTSLSCQ